jgi:hypothetical protein
MVPFWLLDHLTDGTLKHSALAVYCAMVQYANRDRVCWPANVSIMDRAACTRNTYRQAIRELEALGALVVTRREGYSNSYWLPMMPTQGGGQKMTLGQGSKNDPRTITSELQPLENPNTPILQGELLVPAQRAPQAGDFKAFWSVAVRKAAIANARTAYAKALKKVTPDVIQVTWERHNRIWATWPKDTRTYIPYPASWLNSESWHNDDPEFRGGGMVADALANMTDEEAHLAMFGAFRHNGHSQTQAFPAITDTGDTASHPEGR